MKSYSDLFKSRRQSNQDALSAFAIIDTERRSQEILTVREGKTKTTIFTIGYERRDGDELISKLIDHAVDVLIDVRERPFSRKPDFRRAALSGLCQQAGIDYQSWTRLGSTASQREIYASGDLAEFMRRFRSFAKRGRSTELDELALLAQKKTIAMICYERCHRECHRSILAELLTDRIDATIVAIL